MPIWIEKRRSRWQPWALVLWSMAAAANAAADAADSIRPASLRSRIRRTSTATTRGSLRIAGDEAAAENDDLFCKVEWIDQLRRMASDEDGMEISIANNDGSIDDDDDDVFRCHVVRAGVPELARYHLPLPEILAAEQQRQIVSNYAQSHFYVRIPGGSVDEAHFAIRVPDPDSLQVVSAELAGDTTFTNTRNRRRLADANEPQTAVVVRIVDRDGRAPPDSASDLYRKTFQADTSLKYQFEKCSAGQTIIQPQGLGVIEVRVSTAVVGLHDIDRALLEAEELALQQVNANARFLEEYASLVLYVLPDTGNWLAFATIGGGSSVYNGAWGGYVHANMHEVGHNFKLWHANDELAYADHTGYMSGSITGYHDQDGFPANCYNAANHWLLGWYPNARASVSSSSGSIVKLAPFVDYRELPAGTDYNILLQIPDRNYYAQYNRATSFNSGTHDHRDKLVVVREDGDGTELIVAMEKGDTHDGFLEVCDVVPSSGNTPEHLVVSVGRSSSCQDYWDSQTFVTQNSGNNGACGNTMARCQTNSDCCSNRCSMSASRTMVCTANLDVLTRDRTTADVLGNRNRVGRGN